MTPQTRTKQRVLQISFGLGLIFIAFLIELLAIHPSGIYSYTQKGYKAFQIGLSKEGVLEQINHQKTIRTIQTCDPEGLWELKSRKGFEMKPDLASSDAWICHDRKSRDFLFFFNQGALDRILVQRLRFGKKPGSILFSGCRPEILKDIDNYLATREKLALFYDEK